jgi:hypothetical protein
MLDTLIRESRDIVTRSLAMHQDLLIAIQYAVWLPNQNRAIVLLPLIVQPSLGRRGNKVRRRLVLLGCPVTSIAGFSLLLLSVHPASRAVNAIVARKLTCSD